MTNPDFNPSVFVHHTPYTTRSLRSVSRQQQQGLTLLEILIAMSVGLLLLLGATSMFVSNKRIYREQQIMAHLQENMRFTAETMLYDLRMAGYVGCANNFDVINNLINVSKSTPDATSTDVDTPDWHTLDDTTVVEGMEGSSSDADLQWQPSGAKDNINATRDEDGKSDGFSVRYLEPMNLVLTSTMASTAAALQYGQKSGSSRSQPLRTGMPVAVADCQSVDLFVATAVTGDTTGTIEHTTSGGLNTAANLSKIYAADAELHRLVSRRYMVLDSDAGDSEFTSLYLLEQQQDTNDQDGDGDRSEYIFVRQLLVSGVESMQVVWRQKGEQEYRSAGNTNLKWDDVEAVRLSILFRSEQENHHLSENTGTYTLLGGGATEYKLDLSGNSNPDHALRRIFSTTVQIRNRI